jgi:hypothetical protein
MKNPKQKHLAFLLPIHKSLLGIHKSTLLVDLGLGSVYIFLEVISIAAK